MKRLSRAPARLTGPVLRLVLAALIFFSAGSSAVAAPDRFDPIRTYIRQQLVERSIPSVAVAVVEDGRIVWEEGFGWADRERRIGADAHTMYSIASISKPMTATGLLALVEARKLDLDKPANDYLGSAKLKAWVGDARRATVRTVAGHTSGLPAHAQFFYADEPYRPPTRDETILRYGNLVTPPGEAFEYSNLGYGVLDHIIARVSGRSYADYMRTEVFLPLGMTRTSVGIGPGLERYVAERYGPDGTPIPFYQFDHDGASAIYASAHDMARFALFQLKARLADQKAILSAASIDELHRPLFRFDPEHNPHSYYGLGFSGTRQHGHRLLAHGGRMGGVSTFFVLFPDRRGAIVVLANASGDLSSKVFDRIAAAVFPGWKVADPAAAATPQPTPKPEPFAPPAELVGDWQGTLATYAADVPVQLTFRSDGEVRAKFGDQLTALVDSPRIKDGVFTGTLRSTIGTPDAERYDYTVLLSLRPRGPRLTGVATAVGAETPRVRNALSYWLTLEKSPQPPQ